MCNFGTDLAEFTAFINSHHIADESSLHWYCSKITNSYNSDIVTSDYHHLDHAENIASASSYIVVRVTAAANPQPWPLFRQELLSNGRCTAAESWPLPSSGLHITILIKLKESILLNVHVYNSQSPVTNIDSVKDPALFLCYKSYFQSNVSFIFSLCKLVCLFAA
jgi:hypothetical protein